VCARARALKKHGFSVP